MSVTVKLTLPDDVFATVRRTPGEFASELRVAAAAKWYEIGAVSQEKAAEIAGLSRADFLTALSRFKVSPFQYTAAEVREELRDAVHGLMPASPR
jgi:predicted HTH domain antitoxin